MAISFPIATANLVGTLHIAEQKAFPSVPKTTSQTEGGETLIASRGDPLWYGEISLEIKDHYAQAQVEAIIDVANRPGASFLFHDARFNGPAADIGGATLGVSTPSISAVASNNLEIDLTDLPAGYVLTRGDLIGWSVSGVYYYHRIVTGGTADGSGDLADVELSSHVDIGVTHTGANVDLVQPVFKAKLLDVQYGAASGLLTAGAKLTFQQTFGA